MKNVLPRAVVLSHGPGGLGVVRSLARRGIPVTVFAYESGDLVLLSRFPQVAELIPGADDGEKERALLEKLLSFGGERPVLLMTSDRLVAFVSRHRKSLAERFRFCIPRQDLLTTLNDKRQETRYLSSLGVSVPATVETLPSDVTALESALRLPIIFKPHSFHVNNVLGRKNIVVTTRAALEEFYAMHRSVLPDLLAQEVIPGPDTASWVCSCTFDRAYRLLDCSIKRKLRMYPPGFGVSSFAVSRSNEDLLELTRGLGAALEYQGHANVEFRWDYRDETYKYIEINPRVGQNVEFDEATGLPTVWNTYRVAIDDVKASGLKQRDNVYFLDLGPDLISRISDGESIAAILWSYVKTVFRRRKGQYFAFDDPVPGIVAAYRFMRRLNEALFRRLRGAYVRGDTRA